VREIRAAMSDAPSYSAVRTTATILERKGCIAHSSNVLGVLLTGLPVILGKLRLARLARSARTPEERRVLDLLGALRAQMGIRRGVSVRVSSRRTVPFTWREQRPVIMLPESVAGGRLEKLRSIFLHELRHVAWHDALARAPGGFSARCSGSFRSSGSLATSCSSSRRRPVIERPSRGVLQPCVMRRAFSRSPGQPAGLSSCKGWGWPVKGRRSWKTGSAPS